MNERIDGIEPQKTLIDQTTWCKNERTLKISFPVDGGGVHGSAVRMMGE